mgnify:CR=1 FL=1
MKKRYYILAIVIIAIFTIGIAKITNELNTVSTSGTTIESLSNKKIEWGIKRNDNHQQPDLGAVNKKIIDELNRNSYGQ